MITIKFTIENSLTPMGIHIGVWGFVEDEVISRLQLLSGSNHLMTNQHWYDNKHQDWVHRHWTKYYIEGLSWMLNLSHFNSWVIHLSSGIHHWSLHLQWFPHIEVRDREVTNHRGQLSRHVWRIQGFSPSECEWYAYIIFHILNTSSLHMLEFNLTLMWNVSSEG